MQSMVSLQTTLSSEEKRSCCSFDGPVPRKRKWEDEEESDSDFFFANEPCRIKQAKAEETATKVDIELHLDSPLPLEWQRCLDIESGQMYFYNTRTHKRTSKDPRESPDQEPAPSGPSLDLELNLACEPAKPTRADKNPKAAQNQPELAAPPPPPWADGDRREMVAAVCMRCHMLVMMCKSTLSCPNCKFVHPPSHNSLGSLNKPGFKLLCL